MLDAFNLEGSNISPNLKKNNQAGNSFQVTNFFTL